jgi:hypothetical protein
LVLHPVDLQTFSTSGSFSSSSSSATAPPRRLHTVLFEYARLRYRITGPTGELVTSFAADPEPFCQPLDNCGVSGALRIAVRGFDESFDVAASNIVRRRVGARRALADLRAGRLGLDFAQQLSAPKRRAVVSENLVRAGGPGCTDTNAGALSLDVSPVFGFRGPNGQLSVSLSSFDTATDLLRTHCPGPSASDIYGTSNQLFGPGPGPNGNPIAQDLIAVSKLGAQQITVALRDLGRFVGTGYSGTRGGLLRFSLTLTKLTAGTRSERLP